MIMKKNIIIMVLILLVFLTLLCIEQKPKIELEKTLKITTAFKNGEWIPKKYTCDGMDLSPPIRIENVSKDVKSFVIIVEDPDAPYGVFTHWIAWNITSTTIPEGIPKIKDVREPIKMKQGLNDFGEIGYRGPCPPPGKPHRYFIKVYALDIYLTGDYDKESLLRAIEGHVIQYGEIYGIYGR